MEIGAEPEPKTWEDVVPDFDFRFGGLEATALSPTTMSRWQIMMGIGDFWWFPKLFYMFGITVQERLRRESLEREKQMEQDRLNSKLNEEKRLEVCM